VKKIICLVLGTLISLVPIVILANYCDKKGDSCTVSLSDLHPTQPNVGYYEVKESQLPELEEQVSECKGSLKTENCFNRHLKPYLSSKKEIIPVIYSYNKQYDMVDHHHLSYALWMLYQEAGFCTHKDKLEKCDIPVYINIIHNYSNNDFNESQYWQQMTNKNYFWPYSYDGKGKYIFFNYADLPQYVSEMKDDPYRSYFGLARNQGGFKKPDRNEVYFYQFKWAACARLLGFKSASSPPKSVFDAILFLDNNASKMSSSCTNQAEFKDFPRPTKKNQIRK
jgi:hypothetical protein